MGLKKQLIDIPAMDGLNQKVSPYRLPIGKSATAVNMVANKQGQLEKRLGFTALGAGYITPPGTSQPFTPSVGVTLANWQQNLLAVQRGSWLVSTGGSGAQTLTALSQYSVDDNAWVYCGAMPEVNIVGDAITSSASGSVSHVTDVVVGDYRMQAWLEGGFGVFQILKNSTGVVVVPPGQIDSTHGGLGKLELINTGLFIIATYCALGSATVYATFMQAIDVPGIPTWAVPTAITATNAALSNNFSTAQVIGDAINWLFAFGPADGGGADTVIFKLKVTGPTITFVSSCIVRLSTTDKPASFGLRADTVTGLIALGFTVLSGGSIAVPSAAYLLDVALVTYATMVQVGANVNVYTAGAATSGIFESPPGFISVGYVSSVSAWTVAWSPYNSKYCWAATGPGTTPELIPQNNTRITAAQFTNSGGPVLAAGSFAGTLTRVTWGVHLASRFIELNGILYCLGYIPSITQGGYLLLAADFAAEIGSPVNGTAYPMRPCGQIQTRTSLMGSLNSPSPTVPIALAGANFTQGSDAYATASVSYGATSVGNRIQPAAGYIQFQPQQGYPSANWGTMTAFGGALPTTFAGTNLFEQNFLYCPDGIGINYTNAGSIASGFVVIPTVPGTGSFTWTHVADSWTWIVTYEQFDEAGNYHQSARSVPFTISGQTLIDWGLAFLANGSTTLLSNTLGGSATPISGDPVLNIPTLGPTLRMQNKSVLGPCSTFGMPTPQSTVNIGIYRTGISTGPFAQTYFRVADPTYDNAQGDQVVNGPQLAIGATAARGGYLQYTDITGDSVLEGSAVVHPLLYGDGTNGNPGALDDFCPPATPIMVRHQERLFVSRGNQVLYSKQRGQLVGVGYNEQVNASYVGNDDPLTGAESMDTNLVLLKLRQLYFISGQGPADDGSGNSFSSPQPVPTDAGCIDPRSVKTTPEGVYYQSGAGLRLFNRSLAVDYAGGPVETEFATYPQIVSTVLYPTNNRVVFVATSDDASNPMLSEWIYKDYVLGSWTTAQLGSVDNTGVMACTVANARRIVSSFTSRTALEQVLYLMTKDGSVWQENDPLATRPYFDTKGILNSYVSWGWLSPFIKADGDMGRFRMWDVITQILSNDPHGLQIMVGDNYGNIISTTNWTWAQISSGGTPLSHVRSYCGQLGEGFFVGVSDVLDPVSSVTGHGATLIGLTCAIGTPGGNFKLAASVTQ